MKVYFAADFARAGVAEQLAQRCVAEAAIEVASRWHRVRYPDEESAAGTIGGPADASAALAAAKRNLEDLDRADAVVVLTTGELARGGRHFETGYAFHAAKDVVLVGPIEHAFHRLPGITTSTEEELPSLLRAMADRIPPHDRPSRS